MKIKAYLFAAALFLFCLASCTRTATGATSATAPNADLPGHLIPPISEERPPETDAVTLWGDMLDDPGEITVPAPAPHDFVMGGSIAAWGDTVYYVDSRVKNIKYQKVDSVREFGLPLYSDALADGGADPFSGMDRYFFLVDEAATAENNGSPVLLVAETYYNAGEDDGTPILTYETKLGFFDTYGNKWTQIKETNELIAGMALYKDTIFLLTVDNTDSTENTDGNDEFSYAIVRLDRDGSGYERIIGGDSDLLRLCYASGGTLYYLDEKTFAVCAYDLDSGQTLELFRALDPTVLYADGEYIYYEAYGDGDDFTESHYFARRRLDGTGGEEIIFHKTYGFIYDGVYYYTDGNDIKSVINDVLYSYSLSTGEKKTVSDISGYNLSNPEGRVDKIPAAVTGTYMIFDVVYMNAQHLDHFSCLDLVTGREWKIPY